jgi:phosphonoacetaldehyde hydrolase
VDFGSLAPVTAFAAAFESFGVPVHVSEIRKPMGLEKRRHLEEMLSDNDIRDRWRAALGTLPTDRDVERLYEAFNHHIVALLPRFADPIPGVLETVAKLRAPGVKIGSNSGYSAPMMDVLSRAARERGFEPDCCVSSSDVAFGRPAPDLSLRCLELLGLESNCIAIKVDDTRAGIEEGRNAGLWTVAVAISGNEVGLSLEEWSALDVDKRARLRRAAYDSLRSCNPDYVIDTVAQLYGVVDLIEARIAAGDRPAVTL